MTTSSMAATDGPAALAILRQAYEDRLASVRETTREAATAGDAGSSRSSSGVVGVIGNAAPVELVLAAGKRPVQIAPEPPGPTPYADPWMEPEFGWEDRSLLNRTLRGDVEALDLLIVSRSYHQVYYYLKEIVRQGQGRQVPPLHMYDLMQSQRDAVRAYGIGRTQDLKQRLERLGGRPISDDDLRAAIQVTNRQRRAIRELLERRRQGRVSGATAIRVIGAGHFMDPASYTETLAAYLSDLAPDSDLTGRPRLLVATAEPLYHPAVHDAIEAAGALVVAEDDWWGARAAGRDIPEDAPDPLTAIFEKYFTDAPSLAVSPRAPREAWLREQIEQGTGNGGIDGVVFYMPPSDHLFGWYYPGLKAYLDGRGMPSVVIRDDVLDAGGPEKVAATVAILTSSANTAKGVA